MNAQMKTFDINLTRTIPASPAEVYDAWMDPANPGSIWHGVQRLTVEPKVDGLFYLVHRVKSGQEYPHFGRFLVLDRAHKLEHTWMSEFTLGQETTVTVTFEPKGRDTLVTLQHLDLPDDKGGRGHEGGWNYFLDSFYKKPH